MKIIESSKRSGMIDDKLSIEMDLNVVRSRERDNNTLNRTPHNIQRGSLMIVKKMLLFA